MYMRIYSMYYANNMRNLREGEISIMNLKHVVLVLVVRERHECGNPVEFLNERRSTWFEMARVMKNSCWVVMVPQREHCGWPKVVPMKGTK